MFRLAQILLASLVVFVPTMSMAGPAEDAAAAIDRLAAVYSANDVEAMLKVYASDAILQGTSEPQINAGAEAIRKYFRGLPNSGNKVTIQERQMVGINERTALGLGFDTVQHPACFSFLSVQRGN